MRTGDRNSQFDSAITGTSPASARSDAEQQGIEMTEDHFERRVRELEAFGDRGSAGKNEHRAAQYLARELREAGIEPVEDPFYGARSLGWRLLVHVLVAALGAALLWRAPVATFVLGAAALVSMVVEQSTRAVWLSWPACRARSLNVWGRVSGAAGSRRRVLLSAHYDTQHSGWVWTISRRMARIGFRSPLLLKPPMLPVAGLMAGQIVLGVIATAMGVALWVSVLGAVLLLAYAVLTMLFLQWGMGRPIPGAADNASGVAAALAIAQDWRANPPADDVELIVLLCGCEESGMMGAAAWADAHRGELKALPTRFLNIDGIGFGPPRVLGAEVPAVGLPARANPDVLKLCLQVAQEMQLNDVGPHALPGPTDGLAFLARGMRGATIVGFKGEGILPNYHTFDDTSQNLDWPAARAGLEFARRVCRRMALAQDAAHDAVA